MENCHVITGSQREIPQDVVSLIIDTLGVGLLDETDRGCRKALQECLLVSRAFCHLSRLQLFRCVTVFDSHQDTFFDRVAKLRDIMIPQHDPQLGILSYIRIFKIKTLYKPRALYTKQDMGLCVVLEALRDSRAHLSEFWFDACQTVQWDKLGSNVQELICSILRFPSLSAIHLRGLEGVPYSILFGVTCRNLNLSKVVVSPSTGETVKNVLLHQLHLETFTTDSSFLVRYLSTNPPRIRLHDTLMSPFSRLKKLTAAFDSESQFKEIITIMSEARFSLQETTIILLLSCFCH
ncbi:hypothetical protein GALMADRAFT_1170651 [Galerina marginata CBS 339.88]|uniref:F-box domain-containing protein n=1 Tax=Galerina marginata (strain CBS 339.88) TaxID=685588 RepID=A0A067TJ86_GALM3|nr:hypothetical protein GALMADRAFT_1170651 [Galerina marginata CBS 339.88]